MPRKQSPIINQPSLNPVTDQIKTIKGIKNIARAIVSKGLALGRTLQQCVPLHGTSKYPVRRSNISQIDLQQRSTQRSRLDEGRGSLILVSEYQIKDLPRRTYDSHLHHS